MLKLMWQANVQNWTQGSYAFWHRGKIVGIYNSYTNMAYFNNRMAIGTISRPLVVAVMHSKAKHFKEGKRI